MKVLSPRELHAVQRGTLHPMAAFMMAVFALCAALALAADLGRRDAAQQFAAQGTPVLAVYSPGGANGPALDEKAAVAFRTITGVRAAAAIAELNVKLTGLKFALPATVYAVPGNDLKSLSLPLQQGTLPGSRWRAQALCGAALAARLAETAGRVGRTLPGTVRLSAEDGSKMDVQLSGAAEPIGSARDDGLWMEEETARALFPEQSRDGPLPVTRIEAECRSVAAAAAVAAELRQRGYLVINPVEAQARMLEDGKAMTWQWGILAALALAGAMWALLRHRPASPWRAALVSIAAASAGVALAAVLMQIAMLLGAPFFLSADARYLLDGPRLLAVGIAAVALPACATFRYRGAALTT